MKSGERVRLALAYWIGFLFVVGAIAWVGVTVADLRKDLNQAQEDRAALVEQVRGLGEVPVVKGPAGHNGTNGRDGVDGDKGPSGAAGRDGLPGEAGKPGERGPDGKEGKKGDKGETGDKGEKGEKGDKGDTGATGATGATGPQGPPGPQGEIGYTCPSGYSMQTLTIQGRMVQICVME